MRVDGWRYDRAIDSSLTSRVCMFLVFSTSLHPTSRSRILASVALAELRDHGVPCELIDLSCLDPLPPCNGDDCYSHETVGELAGKIASASGILIAAPIYNYDVSAACKNLIELTGSSWNDKVVALVCSAGGQGSYMAPMSFLGSLMLDFHCLIVPRFVYTTDDCFTDDQINNDVISERIKELTSKLVKISSSLAG